MSELDPQPATEFTRAANAAAVVDFDDDVDFAGAAKGRVAQLPDGQVKQGGFAVWDVAAHDFLRTEDPPPDTVHPGLWRQGRLNAHHGLFEVADGVWQARGYDISNITFIAADHGWLIIDPLTTEATAAACLGLANDTLGERPVTAVIYTHSHVDHFGGVLGVTSAEAVAAGDVRIIAPEGFLAEAVKENSHAGPIMIRRAMYQFGPLLAPGPRGQVDAGLGAAVPIGTSNLLAPTETIDATGTELDVDGIRIVFQNTPDAEAPAEMNFFFPDKSLLCLAENCTHTLHNLYPIRGAQVRDSLAWSKYLQEALLMWGDHTDVCFASHHWPRFGRDDAKAFIALQRDVYRWMHDQTLRLANHGLTPDEIAAELSMPGCFAYQSHVQGYYGTVSHNVRSVYNRYLGWYDGNPANLHPLPPAEAGGRYVEMMGGADAVIAGARRAFDDGDYRWVVQVLNHVVFDDPNNRAARQLSAEAMEQLGYQAESATWRNAYLMGAFELRHGSLQLGQAMQPPMATAMTGELLVDSMGVRFNPARFREAATMQWHLTDLDEHHLVEVRNQAISQRQLPNAAASVEAPQPDVSLSLDRPAMVAVMDAADRFDSLVEDGTITIASGDQAVAAEFLAALDVFQTANLIEP
ncbi:MAG: alkyl sulfatase dimerization domain-containing protein [Microthrixaceae bacterium]